MRPCILLTGASGQLGTELRTSLAVLGEVVAPTRAQLDLREPAAALAAMEDLAPEIVVNAAAYTDVEAAENDEATVRRINALTPALLADACRARGALWVQFSTDFVFDGRAGRAYRETDAVNPQSVYGRSKAECESLIRASGVRHLILRSAWLYSGRGSRDFVRTLLRLANTQERLRVVCDQIGSPTPCHELASATAQLIAAVRPHASCAETLHVTCAGAVSRDTFARHIVRGGAHRGLCLDRPVDPILSRDWPSRAARPEHAALDCTQLAERYGVNLPRWDTALEATLDHLREET
ncbi:MAG: dTDP-4-dehydrorhamnose reductase [Panacagrimonas sp.]